MIMERHQPSHEYERTKTPIVKSRNAMQAKLKTIDANSSSPIVTSVKANLMLQRAKRADKALKKDCNFTVSQPLFTVKEEKEKSVQREKKENALWEFKGDNEFEFYKKKDRELIETAYRQKNSTIKIKIDGKEYEINFDKMIQTNIVTNYSRKVSRIPLNNEALDFQLITWKVKLDSGVILAYDDNVNQSIEKAYSQKEPSFITVIKGTRYIIDFGEMKQINEATQYKRDLFRELTTIPSSALWLWLDNNKKYSGYSKENSKSLEDQFQMKVKKFNLTISQTNYEIDFDNFTQTNLNSNKVRGIKRVPLEVLLDCEVWEWEDDKSFTPYRSSEISTIERAYESKHQILSFTMNKNWYTIDLHKMTQINDSTSKSKTIRRIPPVPPLPKLLVDSASVVRVPVGTLWECESDNDYVKYPKVFCNNLNAVFNSGNNTYFYNHEGTPFVVDFTKMVQINQVTQKARAIRKFIAPNTVSNNLTAKVLPKKPVLPESKLVVLDPFSSAYKEVKDLFDKTMSGKYKNITITLLINPHTKSRYNSFITSLKAKGTTPLKTLLLFHGTSKVDPKIIYDGYYENFDAAHRKVGLWGKGIYFATDAFYSCNWFAYDQGNEVYSIIVAEVAVGNYYDYGTSTDRSLLHPPNLPNDPYKRYNSVSGITKGTRVHTIYSSNQAYSKYLITYSI